MKTKYGFKRTWAAIMRMACVVFCMLALCPGAIYLRAQVITGIEEIIPENEHLVKVNTSREFGFTEGCTWDGESALYFSDIPNNKIMRYDITSGVFSDWAESTEGANGTCLSRDGFLYVAESGARRVAVYNRDGQRVRVIAESFNGRALNSPNDLCVDGKGGVYFSDPRYGNQLGKEQEIDCVYYVKPGGEIIRVIDDRVKPNGIMLSPDEKILYVNDSWFRYVRAYDIKPDGAVENGRNFALLDMPEWTPDRGIELVRTGADGMCVDALGNLYVAAQTGLQIFNVRGERLANLVIPEKPTNCTFGGKDMDVLFITAQKSLYSIRTKIRGVRIQ